MSPFRCERSVGDRRLGCSLLVRQAATADETAGSYTVTVSAAGAVPVQFDLTNTAVQPVFSNLAGPTIAYGTSPVTLSGTILAGSTAPTGDVAITLDGVTQSAAIDGSGSFSSSFSAASLGVADSPYAITYAYAANSDFTGVTDTSQTLTLTPAPLMVTAANPSAALSSAFARGTTWSCWATGPTR